MAPPWKTPTPKKLAIWTFAFFLVKGLLWLTIPALIAFLAS